MVALFAYQSLTIHAYITIINDAVLVDIMVFNMSSIIYCYTTEVTLTVELIIGICNLCDEKLPMLDSRDQ